MKNIRYKVITIEGFKSFAKPTRIELDSVGVNLVRGVNGVGKSTLINALLWCEYGINLSATVDTWEDRRPATYKGTRVVVERTDGEFDYMIARHFGYKATTKGLTGDDKLMVFVKPCTEKKFEPHHLVGEKLNKAGMQELIDTQIGVNGEVFLSSIVFGQNVMSLVKTGNDKKRELFEDLFNVGFVDDVREHAKNTYDKTAATITQLDNDIRLFTTTITQNRNQIEYNATIVRNWSEGRAKRLEGINTSMAELKDRHTAKKKDVEAKMQEAKGYSRTAYEDAKAMLEKMRDTQRITIAGLRRELPNLLQKERENTQQAKYEKEQTRTQLRTKATALNTARNTLNTSINQGIMKVSQHDTQIRQCEQRIKEFTASIDKVETHCPSCNGKLKKEKVEEVKENIRQQIVREEQALAALQENKTLTEKLLKEKQDQLPALDEDITDIEGQIAVLTKELTEMDDECDTRCNAIRYNNEQLIQAEENNIDITAKEDEVNELREGLEGLFTLEKDIEVGKSALKSMGEQWNSYKVQKQAIEDEVAPETNSEQLEQDIVTKEEAITAKQTEMAEAQEELKRIKWWIDKGLGASGLKAFVFQAMLSQLNQYAAEYAERLGFRVEFSLDMSKKSRPFQTLIYTGEMVRDYNDLSGGQRKRADIGIAFAMHDLISSKANINILYMDEVFEALDSHGVEIAFDLLREKAQTKTVFLITHNEVINGLNTKEIWLELDEDGNTIIAA